MNKRIEKGIYWDRAWSLIEGCKKVSEGCENCWAEQQTIIRQNNPSVYQRYHFSKEDGSEGCLIEKDKFNGEILFQGNDVDKPYKIKKPQIFSIWNDLFHDAFIDDIDYALDTITQCPQHTFLALTKRPENINKALFESDLLGGGDWIKNFWIGVSIESNKYLNRYDILNKIYAGNIFISYEPLLERIDIKKIDELNIKPNWVIMGAETGKKRRPCNTEWLIELASIYKKMNVPIFVKAINENNKIIKDITVFPIGLRYREIPF